MTSGSLAGALMITRSAPATDGGFVFAIDPKCELHCLDARNGELIWKKFLPAEYDSQIPAWYNGQCPLIDDNRVVIATGGRAVLLTGPSGVWLVFRGSTQDPACVAGIAELGAALAAARAVSA